jgi:nucleoside-diphosphate kinase
MDRTLVVIKPDGVQRSLTGRIIQRFEDAGLKIVAMKMVWIDKDFAKKHYFDLEERRGEKVFRTMTDYLVLGPVVAMVLEGVESADNVRRLVGATEPKSAAPGTIRGDFTHHSFAHADTANREIRNVIHASGNAEEAKYEIGLWFADSEIHEYASDQQHHHVY